MKIMLALLSVFIVVAGVCTSQVPSPSPEIAVRQADKAWSEAALSNDVEKMLAFYDEKGCPSP
jgi:biopolymer transport protein ExbD